MILAQTVLKIFCWQDSIGLQYISQKSGIIQSNNHRISQKVNRVICIMHPNSMPDMMILAWAVLHIFCWQLYCTKFQHWKGETIQTIKFLPKVNQVICIMYPNSMPDIKILAQAVLQVFCWQDCFIVQNAKVGKGRYFSQMLIEICQKLIRSSIPWTKYVSQISWS